MGVRSNTGPRETKLYLVEYKVGDMKPNIYRANTMFYKFLSKSTETEEVYEDPLYWQEGKFDSEREFTDEYDPWVTNRRNHQV